jgi:hypothetical protein
MNTANYNDWRAIKPKSKFSQLEMKLCTELHKLIDGSLKRKVKVLDLEHYQNHQYLSGRQVLWLVIDSQKLSSTSKAMCDFRDITRMKLHGDDIERFHRDWNTCLLNMDHHPDEKFLEELYREQIEKAPSFKVQMINYKLHHPDRNYSQLIQQVEEYIKDIQIERNRKAAFSGGSALPVQGDANAAQGVPKGVCLSWWKTGKCKKGLGCEWNHTDNPNPRKKSDFYLSF